jgi:hypothetical protein
MSDSTIVAGLTEITPFLAEDMLEQNGGNYSKVAECHPYAIVDSLLMAYHHICCTSCEANIKIEWSAYYYLKIAVLV